jgi:hypothetical protein
MTYINYPTPIQMFPNNNNTQTTFTPMQPLVIYKYKNTLAESFKPKRAGKNTSHVIFVLDDSGSMQSCRESTISGYNEYLDLQKKDAKETGIPTFISLYKFDGYGVVNVFNRVQVDKVQNLTKDLYDPKGMTNLYDAIGGVMMNINNQLAANKKSERDSIIITILTDGEENSSKTFDNSNVKQMVEKAEAKNWGFMFLGANINAFAVGSKLGFNDTNTMQYNTRSMASTMEAASAMTSRMKSSYSAGMDTQFTYASSTFTPDERAKAGDTGNDK